MEDDATATKMESDNSLQKETKTLRKQLAELESQLQSASKGEQIIREQCNSESNKIIKMMEGQHQKTLDALKESYEQTAKVKDEMLQQRERILLQREQDQIIALQRNSSSSFRGTDGESFFQELVESKMKWKLTNTSKIPHSCDYSSIIHKLKVFFEVKNYTSDIRQDEITKFFRDMKEHPEVRVGVFVSLNTRISGKDSSLPISIEWIHEESQCAIFIQNFKELEIDYVLASIDQIISLSNTFSKLITSSSSKRDESEIFQERIDKARVYIQEYISEAVLLMKRVAIDQKAHKQLVESSYAHTINALKTQSGVIKNAMDILTGEITDDIVVDEPAAPDVAVTPARGKKGVKKA